jgi:phage protein D
MPLLTDPPQVKVNGTPILQQYQDDIVDLRVSQSLSMPSQLTLRLVDPEFLLVDGNVFNVLDAVEVAFPVGTAWVTVFNGEVTSIGADQNSERLDACELVVTAFDKGHRLSKQTRVRTFQNQSYGDVVSQVATEEGLSASVPEGIRTITFAYLIQTTTNFAFLNEIAFRTGYEWRVDGTTLRFATRKVGQPIELEYGVDLRRFKARFSASAEFQQVAVRAWDPLSKREIVGTSTPARARIDEDNHGTTGLATNGRTKAGPQAKQFQAGTLVASSQDEAAQLADALAGRMASADLSARGECNSRPDISAGKTVKVSKAGQRLSGTYVVSSAEHVFSRGSNTITTFTTGGIERSSIVDLLGAGDDRVSTFGQVGLTVGIVSNNKDPDGLGRVRVKFPTLSDNEESWWARVVTPGGGSNSGLMFMPEINDEVLIGFEHGDLRRPFVLGGLWGPQAKPPTAVEKFLVNNKVIEWGLRTAGGTTLAIRGGQAPADKHYKVMLADGTLLYLGEDKTEIVAKNKSIELKSGAASVLITESGDVKLKGTNIEITATSSLKLSGVTLEGKGSASAKLEGSGSLDLKGGGSANLEASGIAAVKGAMVKIN